MGHDYTLPPPVLNVRHAIRQATSVAATCNGKDAPQTGGPKLFRLREAKADRARAGSYPCRKRRNASRVSFSACLVTRAFGTR